jgi:drug/metabolite transporter (DMT)-like permease
MSILSPLTAVVSAIVPLFVGLASGESFTIWGYSGLALALVAVVLVGFVPDKDAVRPTARGVFMAVASGIFIGIFLVIFSWTPSESLLIPLLFNRAANAAIMLSSVALLVLLKKTQTPIALGGLKLAIGAGAIDSVANALLLWGVQIGELSVMGVLSALYPAGTIILAATVLRERIAPIQWFGLVLALSGTVLLALD